MESFNQENIVLFMLIFMKYDQRNNFQIISINIQIYDSLSDHLTNIQLMFRNLPVS